MTTQQLTYPGPESQRLLKQLSQFVLTEPYPFVIDIEKSQGMWLATVDGQRLFDWVGYFGSKLVEHNHPRLSEPEYLKRLAFAANNKVTNPDILTPQCLDYYRLLHELAPKCMKGPELEVYAVNSGAEAVENMLKYFINLHHRRQIEKGRSSHTRRFMYFDQAFHGRTVFALNVTNLSHSDIITKDFHGFIPGNLQVPFPDADPDGTRQQNLDRMQRSLEIIKDLLIRFGSEIMGIVVEPLQGAGGHRVALPEFFQELSLLAHQYEIPLGFDEVQTAGGTLGKMFAVDLLNLPHPPQAIAVAKKFGNGAVYMLKSMSDQGVLDSTWGGSLADMVRFVQEMKIVREERLIEQVPQKSDCLIQGLRELAQDFPDQLCSVRGIGLYQGFSVKEPWTAGKFADRALQMENLFLLTAGPHTIRLRPHLNVTLDDIRQLHSMLRRILTAGPENE